MRRLGICAWALLLAGCGDDTQVEVPVEPPCASHELLLPDGTVAAEGQGKYLKMPIDRISDFDYETQQWRVAESPDDPSEIEL